MGKTAKVPRRKRSNAKAEKKKWQNNSLRKRVQKSYKEQARDLLNQIDKYEVDCIVPGTDGCCENCHRKQMSTVDRSSPYFFEMYGTMSHKIKEIQHPFRVVKFHRSRQSAINWQVRGTDRKREVLLCRQCYDFLSCRPVYLRENELGDHDKNRWQWKNVCWSFFWNLLSGTDEVTGTAFHETYGPDHLWRFIPKAIRKYWEWNIAAGGKLERYASVLSSVKDPFFKDCTVDVRNFWDAIDEHKLESFIRAVDPKRACPSKDEKVINEIKDSVLPCVRCPWGCSEYAFMGKDLDPSLLIQYHLRQVQLNLPPKNHDKMYLVDTSRLDYIRLDGEPSDFVLMNPSWKVEPYMRLMPDKGYVALVCRNHCKSSDQKRLYPHPPKKPEGFILSSVMPDNLSHAVMRPRRQMRLKRSKYNTICTSSMMQSNFGGIDSANVSTMRRYQYPSLLLFNHEILSYASRADIPPLAHMKSVEGIVAEEIVSEWDIGAQQKYGGKTLSLEKRGATYTPTVLAMALQKHSSESSKVPVVVKQRQRVGGEATETTVYLPRSWCPVAYAMQVEDPDGYGAPIKAILPYIGRGKSATMMTWVLCGIVSACGPLHYAVDQRITPHHYNDWTGHVLAHIDSNYMKHRDSRCPKKSPFNGKRNASSLRTVIEKSMPLEMAFYCGPYEEDPESFYKFSHEYVASLFHTVDFPNISVCRNIAEVIHGAVPRNTDKDILIVVGKDRPHGQATVNLQGSPHIKYEARVVVAVSAPSRSDGSVSQPSCFEGVRYARHGGGMNGWWKQFRSSNIRKNRRLMMQHVSNGQDAFPETLPFGAFYYITVYVKLSAFCADDFRLDMHRSLGGQCSVFCGCSEKNPLIVSGAVKGGKDKGDIELNVRKCIRTGCNEDEKYVCSRFGCDTRICGACFSELSNKDETVTIDLNAELNGIGEVKDMDDDDLSYGRESLLSDDECEDEDLPELFDRSEYVDEGADEGDDEEDDGSDSNSEGGEDQVATDGESLASEGEEGDLYSDEGSVQSYVEEEGIDEGLSDVDSESDDEGEVEEMPQSLRERLERARKVKKIRDDYISGNYAEGRNTDEDDQDLRDDDCMDDYLVDAPENPLDEILSDVESESGDELDVPKTNGAGMECTIIEAGRKESMAVPLHVVFNQAGALCARYGKRIHGTQMQKHYIQGLVSTIRGKCFPLLYLLGTLFPRHFWATATHDDVAVLGCAPISCYRKETNPDGFASNLQIARNYLTHSSASTSTCHNLAFALYDIQANAATSELDSRQVTRRGFRVSNTNKCGLEIANDEESGLYESLDSSQGALNLAAATKFVSHDVFVTLTLNQARHPGIRHLHEWKESMGWTDQIPGYDLLSPKQQAEYKDSFEMAYMSVVNRNWLEVRKLLLQMLMTSTETVFKKIAHAFFRDEYQVKRSNLREVGNCLHIHGLLGLDRGDFSDKEFQEFVCSLQRSAVFDLITGDELDEYMRSGLLKDFDDWSEYVRDAKEFLDHDCKAKSCLIRIGTTGTDKDFRCKKKHPVHDSITPLADEFIPMHYKWSDECLDILVDCGLCTPPSDDNAEWTFHHSALDPKRHMGRVTPGASGNMSPVNPSLFAVTRSMQNIQIITGTDGVSRYVVKYVIKMDKRDRCVVFADAHTGAILRAERQFLHNTKSVRSDLNEKKAFKESKHKDHEYGHSMAFPEIQQQLLGYSDVHTTHRFEVICTKPLEFRPTTKLSLDRRGKLRRSDRRGNEDEAARDVVSGSTDACMVRDIVFSRHPHRRMTRSQRLTLKSDTDEAARYDHISLYGLRPVELMGLIRQLGHYYRWFVVEDKVMAPDDISVGLKVDVTKCMWIDCLGRRVKLRKQAISEVRTRLVGISQEDVTVDSWELRQHLLQVIDSDEECPLLFADDDGEVLPIPVFSKVTPDTPTSFLLHLIFSIGEFDTELDIKQSPSMKMCLAQAKLIPDQDLDDGDTLLIYARILLRRVVTEVFPYQPISLRIFADYIVKSMNLFESVLLYDKYPIRDLPPCILTELLDEKDDKLKKVWEDRRMAQLDAIYQNIPEGMQIPAKESVFEATKNNPIDWNPMEVIEQSAQQSLESHTEQRLALSLGVRAVENYEHQFGDITHTKGVLTHGLPGAGKSYVLGLQGLYAMSRGLKVMSTSLMALRANQLGGYHVHRLFGLEVKRNSNIYRSAELARDKVHRKSNLEILHILLTMDVLLLDECTLLSAEQFSQLDIIMRHTRHSKFPFGGVLIFGTLDHQQVDAIQGLPFLLSSHVLTDFTLVKLTQSVRAHDDEALQEIQRITRMNASTLRKSDDLRKRFELLIRRNITFLDSWEDPRIHPNMVRMYAKKKSVSAAMEEYVTSSSSNLCQRNEHFVISTARDMQKTAGSRADLHTATDPVIVSGLDAKVREPRRLLFYRGALFESTVNANGVNQSQLMMMLVVPTQKEVDNKEAIWLWAAPTQGGLDYRSTLVLDEIPDEDTLRSEGWTQVRVHLPEERLIKKGNLEGCRKQYTLRHLVSSTINKQMGNTLHCPVAIEMTEQCSPWEKGQIVVMLSRSPRAQLIFIVGNADFAINRMWKVLCKSSQWCPLIETILDKLTVNVDGADVGEDFEAEVVDYAEAHPYSVCDMNLLPTSETGYVYLLASAVNIKRMYVGETDSIRRRLNEHNSGSGAEGTAPAIFLPYYVVCFLCRMSHMEESQRMSLERAWQDLNTHSVRVDRMDDVETMIENGRRVMSEHNEGLPEDERIKLMICARRRPNRERQNV